MKAIKNVPGKSKQKKEQGIGSTSAGIPPDVAFKEDD